MPSTSIAEELAKKQREISVSEFFERNKQILGYDAPTKALLTAVKEGAENSLDACEEAEVLPDILVEVNKVDKDEFLVVVEDNGPGIVKIFFSSRRRHTRFDCDWSSDVCSSD